MPGSRRAKRLHRTWPQRFVIAFNVVAIIGALVTAGTIAYARHTVTQINKVDLSGSSFRGTKGLTSKDPRNFLIVGADSDAGLPSDDPAAKGRQSVGGIRSDTIMVVRIDPKTTEAKVLSFPRDLWVDIPGHAKGRINSALQYGGADLLIATLKQDFDIDINHYVQVDFAGFKSLVRQLGGIPIYFATPVGDISYKDHASSGLNIEHAGCTNLDETGALQYVRSRHLFRVINGRRVFDGTSDLGRISRQQDFIRRVLQRAIAQGARNPYTLATLVNIGVKSITTDRQTTAGDLIALGTTFRNFDPQALKSFTLPVTDAVRGGADVLDLQVGPAEPVLAVFRGTGTGESTGLVLPSQVAVQVLNGSGKSNQALIATDALKAVGFQTQPADQTLGVARTEVRYAPGMEAQAVLVARYLFANPVLVPDQDATTVTVVTGPDFGAVLKTPLSASKVAVPTTTTTTTTSTTSTTTLPTSTSVGGANPSTTGGTPGTTTTTVAGYVPGPPPPGVSCG